MGKFNRRHFLCSGLALGASLRGGAALAEIVPRGLKRRVVIVGGGWGGLTAARHLRELTPELDVVLVEKNAAFRSLPLSNKWLVGLAAQAVRSKDYATLAREYG